MILRLCLLATTFAAISAFRLPAATPRHPTALRDAYRVDLAEHVNRDVDALYDWAAGCGAQQAEAFQITSYDGYDFFAMAGADVPAGTCLLYVPSNMFLSSYGSRQEFGQQEAAEKLIGSLAGSEQHPLFYLYLKVLVEYERGQESPWYPWRE